MNSTTSSNKKIFFILLTVFALGSTLALAGTTGDTFKGVWDKLVELADDAYLGYLLAGIGLVTGGKAYMDGDKKLAAERVLIFSSVGVLTDIAEKTSGALMVHDYTPLLSFAFLAGW